MAFLGGLGTLSGPLLGALLLEPLQQYFTLEFSAGDLYLIIYGALFLVVILLMPRGIVPALTDLVSLGRAALRPGRGGGARRGRRRRWRRRRPSAEQVAARARGECEGVMTTLLEVAGVSKSFGGLQALDGVLALGGRGDDRRPDRAERLGQDDAVQRDHRLRQRPDAGIGDASRRRPSPASSPARVFALGIGRTFQLTRIFARLTVLENMLVATQRHEGWLRGVARRAASAAEVNARAMDLLDFVGLRPARGAASRQPLLRPAQAARARLRARRRPARCSCSTSPQAASTRRSSTRSGTGSSTLNRFGQDVPRSSSTTWSSS